MARAAFRSAPGWVERSIWMIRHMRFHRPSIANGECVGCPVMEDVRQR